MNRFLEKSCAATDPSRRRRWGLIVGACCLWLAASGCNYSKPAPKKKPSDVLMAMIETYKKAPAYSDEAEVTVRYAFDGEAHSDQGPVRVRMKRPNKLVVKAYSAEVACDGKQMRSRLLDGASKNLDGQVAVQPAPATFGDAEFGFDPMVHDTITAGPVGYPVQLELLFAGAPLAERLGKDHKKKSLPEETLRRRACYKVAVAVDRGEFIFWIDKENHLLHRLEYPVGQTLPELVDAPQVTDVKITVDFHAAKFASDDDFALPKQDPLHEVAQLMPPPPISTNPLLGRVVDDFSFTDLDNEPLTAADLRGQISVLLWFNDHPLGKQNLERLATANDNLPPGEGAAIYAVCAEPTSVSHGDIAQLAKDWGVPVTVVRDIGAPMRDPAGATVFAVNKLPALVVLDSALKIQLHHEGDMPELATSLPTVIGELHQGVDLAELEQAERQKLQATYQTHLTGTPSGTDPDLPEDDTLIYAPEIVAAIATKPEQVVATQKWKFADITAPGDLQAATDPDGAPTVIVLDGLRTTVELDQQGKVLERKELALPPGVAVKNLRVFSSKENKRTLAAFEVGGRSVYVFDRDKLLFSYPSQEQPHDGVQEAILADLNDDGTPELYVGFWGLVGLHQVSMDGKRSAGDRQVAPVLSMALTAPNEVGWKKLLVTGMKGPVLQYNQYLKADPPILVKDQAIHHIYSLNGPTNANSYLAISLIDETRHRVSSLSSEFEYQWGFPQATSGRAPWIVAGDFLPKQGRQWIVASPDGRISLLSPDLSLEDFYTYGEQILGVAPLAIDRKPSLLVLSTPTNVSAWEYRPK